MCKKELKHTLINACSGTGKTTHIVDTMLDLISSGVEPENIVTITFSKRDADNMLQLFQQRKTQSISTFPSLTQLSSIQTTPTITTLYSFCLSNMRTNIIPTDVFNVLLGKLEINEGKYSKKNITSSMITKYLSKWRLFCFMKCQKSTYKDFIGLLQSQQEIPNFIAEELRESSSVPEEKLYKIIKRVQAIIRILEETSYLDFAGAIFKGYYEVKLPNIKHIFIDNFQDLNFTDYAFITNITGIRSISTQNTDVLPCPHFHIYADSNMASLYNWSNNAFMRNYTDFKQIFENRGGIEEITFTENKRSAPQILSVLEAYNGLHMTPTLSTIAPIDNGTTLAQYSKNKDELLLTLANLLENSKDMGTFGVIVDTNEDVCTVSNYLQNCGINTQHILNTRATDIPKFKLFLNTLKYTTSYFTTDTIKALCLEEFFLKKYDIDLVDILKYFAKYPSISSHFIFNNENCFLIKDKYAGTYVVFDVESTGLNVGNNDIIQFAGTKLDSNLQVIEEINLYIKTDKDLTESTKIHGLTVDDLNMTMEESLPLILNFIQDSYCIGHNVVYDKAMLETTIAKHGKLSEYRICGYIDTLDLAYTFLQDLHLPNYKLGTIAEHLQFNTTPNHNARFDVDATVELFQYIMTNHSTYDLPEYTQDALYAYIQNVCNEVSLIVNKGLMNIQAFTDTVYPEITKIQDNVFYHNSLLNIKNFLNQGWTYLDIVNYFCKTTIEPLISDIIICSVYQSRSFEFDNVIKIQTNPKTYGNVKEKDYLAISRAKTNFLLMTTTPLFATELGNCLAPSKVKVFC